MGSNIEQCLFLYLWAKCTIEKTEAKDRSLKINIWNTMELTD